MPCFPPGATIAALASILTLAVGESETLVRYATFGYFILASLLMFMSAAVALMALKSNYLSFTIEVGVSKLVRARRDVIARIFKMYKNSYLQ